MAVPELELSKVLKPSYSLRHNWLVLKRAEAEWAEERSCPRYGINSMPFLSAPDIFPYTE